MYSVSIFSLKFSSNLQKTCLTCRFKVCFRATLRHAWPENSDNSRNVSSFVYHIWVFWCDQGNSKRNYKIRRKIWGFNGLSKCSDLLIIDREFRPGKPLSTEIRRKTDSWFVFERRGTQGNLANSSCYLWRSVSQHSSLSNVRHIFSPVVEEDEEILLNFQTTF